MLSDSTPFWYTDTVIDPALHLVNEKPQDPLDDDLEDAPPPKRVSPSLALALAAVALIAVFFFARDRTPRLTREIFAEQRRQWYEAGIRSYDLALAVELGAQPATAFELSVRDGEVTSFKIDGAEGRSGDPDEYSIAGLFRILDRELEQVEAPADQRQRGIPEGVLLKAEFDERHGFPLRFVRLARANRSCVITVTGFETE